MTTSPWPTAPQPANGSGQRTRVVVVGPVPPFRGGVAHHTASLVEALRRGGAETHVLGHRRLYPTALFAGTSEIDRDAVPIEGQERVLLPLSPWSWLRAARRIRDLRPTLVVLVWWHSLFLPQTLGLAAAVRGAGTSVVLMVHNVDSHERGALDAIVWRTLPSLVDGAVVHGERARRALEQRVPRTLLVRAVNHPPYHRFAAGAPDRKVARQRLAIGDGERVALCFGLVRRYKAVEIALAALAMSTRVDRLLVVGESYLRPRELADRVASIGVGDRVTIVDRYVPDHDVATYFTAADVLIAPHRSASHSGVVQIARAFGLPVIASDVGGMAELVVDGVDGYLVPPGDAAALAGALDRLLSAPADARLRPGRATGDWSALAAAVLEAGAAAPR